MGGGGHARALWAPSLDPPLYPGADPGGGGGGGGWIGCLVTPLWVNCRREKLKIGNHAKQRHVQCARCLSSGHGNPDGKLIVKLFLASVLCAGGGTFPFHALLLKPAMWYGSLLSHPRSKISGSATGTPPPPCDHVSISCLSQCMVPSDYERGIMWQWHVSYQLMGIAESESKIQKV